MNVNPIFSKLENLQLNAYGLFLFKRKLDYIPNPRDGFSVLIEGQIGERKSLNKEESVWKTHAVFDYFQPIAQRMTLYGQLQFDAYHAPNIYENELFRFGGSNSFRGFDEESIFATTKAIATLEFRFLLDRNSSVFAFFNQAYYENSATTYMKDHPYGFGIGISTGTSLGVFRLSYALGSQLNNPISFNAGKIHLGYISYF
jgi:hemolysin activation/secretion protein